MGLCLPVRTTSKETDLDIFLLFCTAFGLKCTSAEVSLHSEEIYKFTHRFGPLWTAEARTTVVWIFFDSFSVESPCSSKTRRHGPVSGVASPFELGGPADLNFRHVTMGIRSRDTIWSKPPATTISLIFDNANYGQNILRTRIETR